MAANILPISACTGPVHQKPEPVGPKRSPSWWTPLFGWSSDPDYIDNSPKERTGSGKVSTRSSAKPGRFEPGCFTEEKARKLRMLTVETSSSHEMYHSAIASRLATEVKNRSGF